MSSSSSSSSTSSSGLNRQELSSLGKPDFKYSPHEMECLFMHEQELQHVYLGPCFIFFYEGILDTAHEKSAAKSFLISNTTELN
jgi:hypothetical protein